MVVCAVLTLWPSHHYVEIKEEDEMTIILGVVFVILLNIEGRRDKVNSAMGLHTRYLWKQDAEHGRIK